MDEFDRAFDELLDKGFLKRAGVDKNRDVVYEFCAFPNTEGTRQYNGQTTIYLLMSEGCPQARGFGGANGAWTYAFTSPERANEFLECSHEVGILTDVNRLFRMTIDEYFDWKEQGKAHADLCIDPKPDMHNHPAFDPCRNEQN